MSNHCSNPKAQKYRLQADRTRERTPAQNCVAIQLPPDSEPPRKICNTQTTDEELYPNKSVVTPKVFPTTTMAQSSLSAYAGLTQCHKQRAPGDFDAIPLGGPQTNQSSSWTGFRYGRSRCACIGPTSSAGFRESSPGSGDLRKLLDGIAARCSLLAVSANPIANAAAADLTLYGADFNGSKSRRRSHDGYFVPRPDPGRPGWSIPVPVFLSGVQLRREQDRTENHDHRSRR